MFTSVYATSYQACCNFYTSVALEFSSALWQYSCFGHRSLKAKLFATKRIPHHLVIPWIQFALYRQWCGSKWLNQNCPSTTGSNQVSIASPRVTPLVLQEQHLFQMRRAAIVISASDCKPDALSVSHHKRTCHVTENYVTMRRNHLHDNRRLGQNIGTFLVNSKKTNFHNSSG